MTYTYKENIKSTNFWYFIFNCPVPWTWALWMSHNILNLHLSSFACGICCMLHIIAHFDDCTLLCIEHFECFECWISICHLLPLVICSVQATLQCNAMSHWPSNLRRRRKAWSDDAKVYDPARCRCEDFEHFECWTCIFCHIYHVASAHCCTFWQSIWSAQMQRWGSNCSSFPSLISLSPTLPSVSFPPSYS